MLQKILSHEIGEIIPGLTINGKEAPYGVLNERSVRATAGIMFLIGIITMFIVISTKNIFYLYPTLILFWIQFFISVFFSPKYAPISWFGNFFTKKQTPEYVGAIQKRFAWSIGLFMASIMAVLTAGFQLTGIIPLSICGICLLFMWMESSIGYCIGCAIYGYLLKKNIIKTPEIRPACAGNICGWQAKK